LTKTGTLAAALAAGAIAAIVAVLPAQGQRPTDMRTLKFISTEKQGDEHAIDTRPKGPSVGDRWLLASTLSQAGNVAGRLEGDCAGVDKTYGVLQCSLVVVLPDGRLTLQGASVSKRIPGVGGKGEEYAVTGGTGAYEGAIGTMRRKSGASHDTLTFTIRG
jgi:Allene oxide cyclase barrel like domain